MYYSLDDNGNIIMSESSDVLPDEYQQVFPSEAPSYDFDFYVSDGDIISPDFSSDYSDLIYPDSDFSYFPDNIVTYDDLIDLLALVPGYNVYPNTQAVSVFSNVLNGLDFEPSYVILSGTSTDTTYLFYSRSSSVSGSSVTLTAPVTQCTYYQYRPSTNSSYVYTYTVSSIGDTSFNFTNQLVYTNLLEGYPDVIPFKQKPFYFLFFFLVIALIVFVFASLSRVRSQSLHRGGKD